MIHVGPASMFETSLKQRQWISTANPFQVHISHLTYMDVLRCTNDTSWKYWFHRSHWICSAFALMQFMLLLIIMAGGHLTLFTKHGHFLSQELSVTYLFFWLLLTISFLFLGVSMFSLAHRGINRDATDKKKSVHKMYRHSTENVLHTKSASVYVRKISWRYHMQYVFWKIIPCLLKCFIKHVDLNESQNCLSFHVLLMQFLKLMSALLFTLLLFN